MLLLSKIDAQFRVTQSIVKVGENIVEMYIYVWKKIVWTKQSTSSTICPTFYTYYIFPKMS